MVNANEDEKTWGERKGQDPLPKKITMLRGVSSPLLPRTLPGHCIPIYGAQYSGIMQQPRTFPPLLHTLQFSYYLTRTAL